MVDKEKIRAEIESLKKHYLDREEYDLGYNKALEHVVSFINSLPEEPVSNPTPNERMNKERFAEACKAACSDRNYRSHYGHTETRDDYFVDGVQWADEHPIKEDVIEDILDMSRIDYRLQHNSIEDGIKYHAEEYSFNIESELFHQLTGEQQKLWRKELERAVTSGCYTGLELSRDKRYKEEPVSEDLEEAAKRYATEGDEISGLYIIDEESEAFKAGAQWQKEQMTKDV